MTSERLTGNVTSIRYPHGPIMISDSVLVEKYFKPVMSQRVGLRDQANENSQTKREDDTRQFTILIETAGDFIMVEVTKDSAAHAGNKTSKDEEQHSECVDIPATNSDLSFFKRSRRLGD